MTTSFHSAREGFCSKSGNDAFYTSKQIFSSCVSDVLLKNPTVFINGIYGSLIYLPFNATTIPVFYIGDHRIVS